MPLMMTSGAASAQAFMSRTIPYTKPAMIQTGAVGTIASNSTGYLLSGFDNDTYAYLDAVKSSGKWYWEQVSGDYVLSGVTPAPTTPFTFGGFSTVNGGVYSNTGAFWDQWDVPPSPFGAIASGSIIGFALDATAHTLKVYVNNALAGTMNVTASPLYPLFAFQTSPSSQVKLGPGRTTYSPPAGYAYL